MTTTVTPEIKQDHTESREWPTVAPDLADRTREDRADWFDPTQGRTIGSTLRDPTRDASSAPTRTATSPRDASSAPTLRRPHPGTQARRRPLRRPHPGTQARRRPVRRPHESSLERGVDKCATTSPRFFTHTGAGCFRSRRSGQRSLPNSQFTSKRAQHESSTCISVGPDVRRDHRHRRGDRIRAISRRSRRRSRQSSLDEDGVGRRSSVRRLACRK